MLYHHRRACKCNFFSLFFFFLLVAVLESSLSASIHEGWFGSGSSVLKHSAQDSCYMAPGFLIYPPLPSHLPGGGDGGGSSQSAPSPTTRPPEEKKSPRARRAVNRPPDGPALSQALGSHRVSSSHPQASSLCSVLLFPHNEQIAVICDACTRGRRRGVVASRVPVVTSDVTG